jgi:hypothetical protein
VTHEHSKSEIATLTTRAAWLPRDCCPIPKKTSVGTPNTLICRFFPSLDFAQALVVRRGFHPVPARAHATPTPTAIFARVVEKEDAQGVLTLLHQTQVSVAKKIAG